MDSNSTSLFNGDKTRKAALADSLSLKLQPCSFDPCGHNPAFGTSQLGLRPYPVSAASRYEHQPNPSSNSLDAPADTEWFLAESQHKPWHGAFGIAPVLPLSADASTVLAADTSDGGDQNCFQGMISSYWGLNRGNATRFAMANRVLGEMGGAA